MAKHNRLAEGARHVADARIRCKKKAILSGDIDASGAAYITGTSPSTGFPVTPGAFVSQTANGIFVAKLNPAASQLAFSASIGGDSYSTAAIAVDARGDVFVTGATQASNFPLTPTPIRPAAARRCASPPE